MNILAIVLYPDEVSHIVEDTKTGMESVVLTNVMTKVLRKEI